MSAHEHPTRRGLLRATARAFAVVVLAGGGALLALRNRGRADCPPRTLCDACGQRNDCERKPRRGESGGAKR